MVKKESETTPEIPEGAKPLIKILETLATTQKQHATDIKTISVNQKKMFEMMKEKPKKEGIDFMEIMDKVDSILNSPTIKTVIDGLFSGGEETAALPPAPVDTAEMKKVNAYYDKQAKFAERMMEAVVSKAEHESTIMKKRAESDFI